MDTDYTTQWIMLVNDVLTRTVKIITWTLPRKIQRNQHRAQKEYEFYEEDFGSTVRTTYVWLTVSLTFRWLGTSTIVFDVQQDCLNYSLIIEQDSKSIFSKEAYDQSVESKLDRYLNRYGWIVKKLIRSGNCVYTLRPN